MWIDVLIEKNLLPDWAIRLGIRQLLATKLREEAKGGTLAEGERLQAFIREMNESPIAFSTQDANEQHYEVPTEFFLTVLGKRLKYSSGYWPSGVTTLDESEEAMLKLTCERAQIENGQDILELGCGWGSLSLYMAEKFPKSRITSVSNSKTQKNFIDGEARKRGLFNLIVITQDMNRFEAPSRYDRIVSVEMFEHMRNYEKLLRRVASWMKPEGLLFIHIFSHTRYAYPYLEKDPSDWIARYFFTGGMMPSDNLFLNFQKDVRVIHRWKVNGSHYQKTCEAWLTKMDQSRVKLFPLFEKTYGKDALKRWVYWRIFFMACAELFGFRGGEEWIVSHYVFEKAVKTVPVHSI